MFMRIGIIGNGFVGGATALLECEANDVCVYDIDPDKCKPKGTSLDDLDGCDVIFICVPTPMNEDGSCDLSFVENTIEEVTKKIERTNLVIRSTVPVGTSESFGVCVMPEFLTETNWENDFINCKNWIIGADCIQTERTALAVVTAFRNAYEHGKIKHCNFSTYTTKEAELVKLVRNTFLATKVSFFNEVENFCNSAGVSYENILNGVVMDDRIGDSHTSVPGPDGKRGFGGKCFPKDVSSLRDQMLKAKINPHIINAVLSRNKLDRVNI